MALTKVSRGLLSTGIVDNSNATAITIDSSENVGIGISSTYNMRATIAGAGAAVSTGTGSYALLSLYDTSTAGIGKGGGLAFQGEDGTNSAVTFAAINGSKENAGTGNYASYLGLSTRANGGNLTEKMRVDSLGNLLVGTSVAHLTSSTFSGFTQFAGGHSIQKRSGGIVAYFDRLTNDGEIIQLRRDGAIVGSISGTTNNVNINSTSTGILSTVGSPRLFWDAAQLYPGADNTYNLGYTTLRFHNIYRGGSTYSTSDRNMKQDIRELTDAERNVAVAAKGLLKAFRFIDRVEQEGDSASIHFGIIAQDLAAAFTAEGLDANDYQVYRADKFTDDDGNEQTRLNVCYENLLAFIISAI